ncbi:MAG: DUF4388 domain-containing protein [Deltaproteobacteria bacterium]|nr:DUF4388 domain-containing protein [Deltaproteobacteria bacterium]MBN2673641.1 DUF4388 domain-containing protein [Deltaproteobacteria bacterium]
MALSGTLSDLGIVDLVQFPGTGKKTGELIIAGIDHEARLYYDKGSLKHVICGENTGIDALVELVSWEEGEFEFRLGATHDEVTIELDLHRALMMALKTRDERREKARKKAEEERRAQAERQSQATLPPAPEAVQDPKMEFLLAKTASKFEYIHYAGVYHRNGAKICSWAQEDVDGTVFAQMISGVIGIFSTHPRKELQKVYLTDSMGTCIGSVIDSDLVLFLAAGEESSLGVVSIAASKISAAVVESRNK